jgi:hypothetical protein
MTRTLRTLLLSATALGALATAAAATPSTPVPIDVATTDMSSMHAPGTSSMHGGTASMTGMHTAMSAGSDVHDAMLDDPTMQAHMAEYGIDTGQMALWHDASDSVDQMHERLAAQGIDVDAMHADCPMLTGDAMASMHGNGGHEPASHHRTQGGD